MPELQKLTFAQSLEENFRSWAQLLAVVWSRLPDFCSTVSVPRTGKWHTPIYVHIQHLLPCSKDHEAQHWPPVSQYGAVRFFAMAFFLTLDALVLSCHMSPLTKDPSWGSLPSGARGYHLSLC